MADRAINFEETTTLCDMFFAQEKKFPDHPLLWTKRDGTFQSESWSDVGTRIRRLSRALISTDGAAIAPGDRVMIVAENRAEWLIADFAIMAAGAISVPCYTTYTVADYQHVMHDCAASTIVCTGKHAPKVMQAAVQLGHPPRIILISPRDLRQNPGLDVLLWDDLMTLGERLDQVPDAPPLPTGAARRTDTACLIYTSGTGGAPKGVMQSHGSILHNCRGAHDVLLTLGLDDEMFLSFLPLSHAYEHTAGQFFPLSVGAQIAYAESLDALSTNIQEVHPTIMTAVPRLYEVLYQKIQRSIRRESAGVQLWFERTIILGSKTVQKEPMSLREWFTWFLCRLLVLPKIRRRFGGRLKAFVSGGAPLNHDIGLFFAALRVRLLQGYGQTEAGPVISVTLPERPRLDAVGPPLRGTEVRIAEDGELCLRGELLMQGYWNNPRATAAVIDAEGWLHTGDIGAITPDGDLQILDRKKDIIVTSGGDNIAPQRIEGFLALEPEIAQAMVYGDRRPHLVALIVADDTLLAENDDPAEVQRRVWAAVNRVNQTLAPVERIRRILLAECAFSVENGMLTPTIKVRRHKVLETYKDRLEALYKG